MKKTEKKARVIEINTRIREMLSTAKTENRQLTEAEAAEKADLEQERGVLITEINIESSERFIAAMQNATPQQRALDKAFEMAVRNAINEHKDINVPEQRDAFVTSEMSGMVPLTIGEIFMPLEKGLIMGSLGVKMQTGLVGDWDYPIIGPVEATINGENVDVASSKFSISKVSPKPNRTALVIEVSNRAVSQTDGKLRQIVLYQLPLAVDRLLNKWLFQATEISSGVSGVFVSPTTAVTYAGEVPTYKEILKLKASVDKTGIQPLGVGAYIMNNTMKAELEATPKDTGSGRMIIENGAINGTPVFVTEYVADNTVYFGYFGYTLVGQFGAVNITVDPYTKASANITRFILNTDYDIKTPRPEAFGKLTKQGADSTEDEEETVSETSAQSQSGTASAKATK